VVTVNKKHKFYAVKEYIGKYNQVWKMQDVDECFNCECKFVNGDKLGLIFSHKGNEVVCGKCAIDLENAITDRRG